MIGVGISWLADFGLFRDLRSLGVLLTHDVIHAAAIILIVIGIVVVVISFVGLVGSFKESAILLALVGECKPIINGILSLSLSLSFSFLSLCLLLFLLSSLALSLYRSLSLSLPLSPLSLSLLNPLVDVGHLALPLSPLPLSLSTCFSPTLYLSFFVCISLLFFLMLFPPKSPLLILSISIYISSFCTVCTVYMCSVYYQCVFVVSIKINNLLFIRI